MIRVLPRRIRAEATALVALVSAPPSRSVDWTCSAGTITPLSTHTDATGRAFALWTPAGEGAATVGATYGA
jgi:hypothetical protein